MEEEFKIIKVQFVPTDFKCVCIYSKYIEDIQKYLKENYYVNEDYYNFNTDGCDDLIHKTDGRQIIIQLKSKDEKIIVHECVHAVMRWSRLIGQHYPADNHELLAYWVEYLFDKIKTELK